MSPTSYQAALPRDHCQDHRHTALCVKQPPPFINFRLVSNLCFDAPAHCFATSPCPRIHCIDIYLVLRASRWRLFISTSHAVNWKTVGMSMTSNCQILFVILCAGCVTCGSFSCQVHQTGATPASTRPATFSPSHTPAFTPIVDSRLLNAHVVTRRVIAGAQPEGDEGFAALRDLGIKTIISVDGAAPDVETAKKFGLRYVHLPITYSTVTEQQGKAIAKAIDEMPGPIYVHCHHGKHRSAAAVAVACVYDGSMKPEQAESLLKTFGTGEDYKGLWKAALDAKPLDPREIRDMNITFVETQKIPKLAEAMVLMDSQFDRLKEIQKAKWQTPKNHPDLDPPHEALQLQENLREIFRAHADKNKPEDFWNKMADAEKSAITLRETLAAKPVNLPAAESAMKVMTGSCASCHKAYRN
jgi:protein tyrosine phosphatase (PTP) superfamily phosphohydrolase (DUF442 family)